MSTLPRESIRGIISTVLAALVEKKEKAKRQKDRGAPVAEERLEQDNYSSSQPLNDHFYLRYISAL